MKQRDSQPFEVVRGEVSSAQLDLVISHFGRRASMLSGISAYHDLDTGELRFEGTPARGVSQQAAEESLAAAIDAARIIHPADTLDMSA